MGKSLLIVVALAALGASWFQFTLSEARRDEGSERGRHQHEVLARQVAHSGFAEAAQHVMTARHGILEGALDSLGVSRGGTSEGKYETSLSVSPGPPLDIVVRTEGQSGPARHVVEGLFRDTDGDGTLGSPEERLERIPPYLRYAVFSGGPLRLVALPRVTSALDDANADVHTNGTLNLALSVSALLGLKAVEGFGTYSGELLAVSLLAKPSEAFRPPWNPDRLGVLRHVAPVDAPALDIPAVVDSLQGVGREVRTTSGQLRLLGRVKLGTREDPVVLHVRGDLVLVDVRFEGYGALLVEGGVVSESTLTGLSALLLGRPEGRVGVFADGPILFNGVGDVEGHYMSNGSVTFAGAATLHGGVTAGGSVNFLVAPTVRFLPLSPTVTVSLPHSPPIPDLEMVSMREWEVLD